MNRKTCSICLMIAMVCASTCFGQASTASVVGAVTDGASSAMPNVTVRLISAATGVSRSTITNSTGEYRFENVQPGRYTITVEAAGFETMQRTDVVTAGASARFNFPLRVEEATSAFLAEGNDRSTGSNGASHVLNNYTPCVFRQQDYIAFLRGLRAGEVDPDGTPMMNVGCSPSVMTWKETADIFGRRVADRYIAIQVNVRNLDPDHEYLIHDVQVAAYAPRNYQRVDEDETPDDPAVLFAAGRDRTLVRGVAQRGQALDRRNLLMRIGEVVGEIASAASVAFTGADFKNAVAIYRAAFIPGMGRIFPDFTIDQLNRLNDSGFSANSAYKIVVPKSGAAPFVTFVPVEIYNQQFKRLKQDELRRFANTVLVVFSGVHIASVADQADVQSFACAPLIGGYLDLSSGAEYTCTVGGSNVASISRVRLTSATDSTEPAIETTVGTRGAATFKVSDLRKLKSPEYQVRIVDKNGKESTSKFVVKVRPVLLKDPAVACTKDSGKCTLTLEGANLGRVTRAAVDCGAGSLIGIAKQIGASEQNQYDFPYSDVAGKTGCQVTFDVDEQTIATGKKVDFPQ